MLDADASVRAFLVAQPAMRQTFGQRVYASIDPPAGYTPTVGPACVFVLRGGALDDIWTPTGDFLVYGASEAHARAADRTLVTTLHGARSPGIHMARCVSAGSLVQNPETGWIAIQSLYQFTLMPFAEAEEVV